MALRCYVVTPGNIEPKNRNRLILNLHPGGFIGGSGESGTSWAIALAGLTGYKVIVVDYRLLPDHPFPAAMDDVTAVWKYLTNSAKPRDVAFVGGSVGGGMALLLAQRAKLEGLPIPGAVVSVSSAVADLIETGDSWYTNAGVDGSVVYDGFWRQYLR